MGTVLIGALEQLLKLGVLVGEERHRYDDDLRELKEEWYEEYKKLETPEGSDNRLDELDLKLRLLGESIVEAHRNAVNKG